MQGTKSFANLLTLKIEKDSFIKYLIVTTMKVDLKWDPKLICKLSNIQLKHYKRWIYDAHTHNYNRQFITSNSLRPF